MKTILIDEIQNEFGNCQSEIKVTVDGVLMQGYQIAKPMNYEPEYFTMEDRKEMADLIMAGKAIAVQFFDDLSPEEQSAYVKNKMNKS